MQDKSQHVVIIGAGPAGLTAAYELTKYSINSIILEADQQVGGLARTVNYKGFRFDIGGHRFFSKVPYINQLWQEILKDDFILRSRLSRIYYQRYFFNYPLKPLNVIQGLGPIETIKIMLNLLRTRLLVTKNDDSLENWIIHRFGNRLYNIFFKTYTEKVWGLSSKDIPVDWALQRIKGLSLKEAILDALFASNNGKDIKTLIKQFYYPKYGPGMMWESFQELLAQKDNPTFLGERVECVYYQNDEIKYVVSRNSYGEKKEFAADHYISSMPLRQLIHALDPPPPAEVINSANKLRYRDYLTVVLIVSRESVFLDNWLYIHSPEVKMGRIQNFKNWSPYMVPDLSMTSLGLEYFLWKTDEEWSWSEERLIDLGIKECENIGIIKRNEVVDGTVFRMPKAYPIYDQRYSTNVEIIQDYLKKFKNLQTIGRNGLHRYNNMDHSMLTGIFAARNIIEKKYDIWSVNMEQEYHEEVIIENTDTIQVS